MFGRRKRYLVKKKLQFKYLSFVFLSMLIPTLLACSALYYFIWQTIAQEIAMPEPIVEYLFPALHRVNTILLISLPPVFLLLLALAVLVSHKIAGPIYKLETELKEILKGDYKRRIKLRAADELKQVAEDINTLLDRMEK